MSAAAADRTHSKASLAGRTVLVTRPQAQAADMAGAIERLGGTAIIFPVIEIRDVPDPAALAAVVARLRAFDYAVFVSPNAVDRALVAIDAAGGWPQGLRAVAIGTSTVRALAARGVANAIAPVERFDSEALLDLPAMQPDAVAGRRFLIFRGDGGRELLGHTLQQRGASVEYAECYRRGVPAQECGPLLAAWETGGVDAVTLTSSEGLGNLCRMIGPRGMALLAQTPVFAPHERIASAARRVGLCAVFLTPPADAGLLAGLVDHFRTAAPGGA